MSTDVPFKAKSKHEIYKNAPWYRYHVGELDPAIVQFFVRRGIPASRVTEHIENIHHKSFEMHPWPIIGDYHFLRTYSTKQAIFPEILPRLTQGDTNILDLGCAFGQDIRAWIEEKVPSRTIYALDFIQDFWEVGFELYNDEIGTGRGMEEVMFEQCDMLQNPPEHWKGQMDIIFAGAFFHVFDYQDQLTASQNALQLLKKQTGSIIFGYQLARFTALEKPLSMGTSMSGMAYFQSAESFDEMWKMIGAEQGIHVKTRVTYYTQYIEGFIKMDDQIRGMQFVVELE